MKDQKLKQYLLAIFFTSLAMISFFSGCTYETQRKLITNSTGEFINIKFSHFTFHIYIDNKDVMDAKNDIFLDLRSLALIDFTIDTKNKDCSKNYIYQYRQGIHFICNQELACYKLSDPIIDFDFILRDLIKLKLENNLNNQTIRSLIQKFFKDRIIYIDNRSYNFDRYLKIVEINNVCFDYALRELNKFVVK